MSKYMTIDQMPRDKAERLITQMVDWLIENDSRELALIFVNKLQEKFLPSTAKTKE